MTDPVPFTTQIDVCFNDTSSPTLRLPIVARPGIINQIRAFLLERGVAVRQGPRFLRAELPGILATRSDVLSPRMLRIIEDLAGDWRRLDERIEGYICKRVDA